MTVVTAFQAGMAIAMLIVAFVLGGLAVFAVVASVVGVFWAIVCIAYTSASSWLGKRLKGNNGKEKA